MVKQVLFINKCNPGSIIPELLTKTGMEVQVAYDAASALKHLESSPCDLVVLMENPSQESWMFCADIRKMTSSPLIVISCGASAASCVKAIEAGADFFLRKPFGPMELISRVNTLFLRQPVRQPIPAVS